MALPRSRSYLGIAKETRPAAGVAPTAVAATDFIPYTSITPADNITYYDDKGVRGSMADLYGLVQGNIYSQFEFAGDVFADTIGYPLSGVLGDVVTTGASAPFSHAISTLNSQTTNGQPITFTLSDYYGLGAATTRQFAGVQFQSVDFKFTADALLTYSAKALGYQSVTAANPTQSFSTLTPVPSWVGAVTLNAASSILVAEGNCTIERPVTPIFTVDNNQRPYQLFAGAVMASGALNLVFETDAQLLLFLNNTQPNLVVDFSQGSGAALTQVKINMTKAAITVGAIKRDKDYVELALTYKAIANTTDAGASAGYSPIKVTLQNAKPSATYA